jgi:multicomponent Na+:H+ antiporter subunit D
MMTSAETILQLTVILPLLSVAGLIIASRVPNIREAISIITGVILFTLVVTLYQGMMDGDAIRVHWFDVIPGLGFNFHVEPLGILFALVASFLWIITTFYAIGYMRKNGESNQTRFYSCFAIAISAVMGIAFAADLFTLFVFYEVLTLSTYPLVTHNGNEAAKKGGRVYLGILLTTSIAFLLFAVIATWFVAGTLDFTPGGVFDEQTSHLVLSVLLVLFVFGVGKAAIMPFHRWLPAAMVAPTPVSALLHAVAVVKAGVFSIMKISIYIFGLDLLPLLLSTQFLLYLAGFTVLMASLIAMRQDSLKARLAYSTISQLSYIIMGALLATASGVLGGSMHIAMHAFGKITLFFCAGAIYVSLGKTRISDMQGIGWQMPITMTAFFIASLSIIGVPPGGGTWSKWFLVMGSLEAGQWFLIVALMISSLLNIAYLLPIPFRAFFPNNQTDMIRGPMREAPLPALIAITVTTLFCLVLFVYPQPLYELAQAILNTAEASYG